MSFVQDLIAIIRAHPSGVLGAHRTWQRVPLGKICKFETGPPYQSKYFSREQGLPLIRIRDVVRGRTETFYRGPDLKGPIANIGDLIVGMDGDFNLNIWPGKQALVNQRVCKLTPDEHYIDRPFLRYCLPGYLKAINDHTSSITVKHLGIRTLEELPLPFPPLPEQRRIAAKIDELFGEIEAGEQELEQARQELAGYRSAVLKAAVTGELTREWRAAETLSESGVGLLKAVLEVRMMQSRKAKRKRHFDPIEVRECVPINLPAGWACASVDQLTHGGRLSAYGVLQPGPDVKNGIPMVRVGDIKNGRIAVESLKRIAPQIANEFSRTRLSGGELLITLVGAIGRTAVVPTELSDANTARAVGVIPLSELVNSEWVELWFRSPAKQMEMVRKAHEVARKTLNLEDVRSTGVALPPRAEQEEIVKRVTRLLSEAESQEEVLAALARQCYVLRQAILVAAFRGHLSQQDPLEEPASKLLARLNSELRAAGRMKYGKSRDSSLGDTDLTGAQA